MILHFFHQLFFESFIVFRLKNGGSSLFQNIIKIMVPTWCINSIYVYKKICNMKQYRNTQIYKNTKSYILALSQSLRLGVQDLKLTVCDWFIMS